MCRQIFLTGLAIAGLCACKNPTAQVKTVASTYDNLHKDYNNYVVAFGERYFDETVNYEKELTQALEKNNFPPKEHAQLLKMQHHARSLISYAVHSRCFKSPPRRRGVHLLERNWQDRYDYNFYLRGTEDYRYQLLIDDERLCAIFLQQMRELTSEQIDISQANNDFFQQVIAGKVKSPTVNEMQAARQKFFKTALAPQIMKVTAQSMARTDSLFPFHRYNYVKACEQQRDSYFETEAGDRTYTYRTAIRKKINCSALQKLPPVEIKKQRKVNCATLKISAQSQQPFANSDAVAQAVTAAITGMNTQRAELDRLVKLRVEDIFLKKSFTPHVEKKAWLLPFMKVLNATKIEQNPPIIKAIDAYHCYLVEANKSGILPLIFAPTTQREMGSVHLNHAGRFFGFGRVEYKPLKQPSVQTLAKAMVELKHELIANWVAMQAAQADAQKIAARKIYATLLNNEFAVAQLLLQNPAQAVVVASLLREFQHDSATPEWLRTFKKFAIAADLAFIPIALLAGFVTGGVGVVPVLLMANAVNFLWIGGAAAEHIVARNRYRLIERALLTGNSEQIARGMKVLRAFHARRRDLIVSGGVGATLSLGNLALIARGLDNLATVPIDVAAAVSADVEMLSMPNETTSDADIHKER